MRRNRPPLRLVSKRFPCRTSKGPHDHMYFDVKANYSFCADSRMVHPLEVVRPSGCKWFKMPFLILQKTQGSALLFWSLNKGVLRDGDDRDGSRVFPPPNQRKTSPRPLCTAIQAGSGTQTVFAYDSSPHNFTSLHVGIRRQGSCKDEREVGINRTAHYGSSLATSKWRRNPAELLLDEFRQ